MKNIPLFKVFSSPNITDELKKVFDSGFIGQGPKVNEFEDILITLGKIEKMEEKEYSQLIENGRIKYLKLFQIADYLKTMESILLK